MNLFGSWYFKRKKHEKEPCQLIKVKKPKVNINVP